MNSQDKSFAEFRRRAKCSFPGMSDQVIRSTWKRGRHSAKVHVLRCQCQDASDIYVSLSYGDYEITEIADRNGHGHNFRLVLMRDDEPLPDLVHTLPSPFNGM